MATVFSILLETARDLGALRSGVATTGSTTTLTDPLMTAPDDFFNGGTIFFLDGDNGGRSAAVEDWTLSTHVLEFLVQPYTIARGDRYAVMDGKQYKREDMIAAINQALLEIGPFDRIDETLVGVDDQEFYTLPTGVWNVKRIEIAAAATNVGAVHYQWRELGGKIRFLDNLPATGEVIRLIYEQVHWNVTLPTDEITDGMDDIIGDEVGYGGPMVSLDIDAITDQAHPALIAWTAAMRAAEQRARIAANDERLKEFIQRAQLQAATLAAQFPVRRISRDPIMSGY